MKKIYLLLFFGCYHLISAQFTQPSPFVPLYVCDDDSDGIGVFNLTDKNQDIFPYNNISSYAFTYFTTMADAQSDTNMITLPTAYTNVSNPQTIYVRITTPYTYGFSSFTIFVYPKPNFNQPPNLIIYQNPYTGAASFDIESQRRILLQGENGAFAEIYETENDAIADVNRIAVNCYTNSTPTQTLWAREYANFEGGCFHVSSFTITVSQDTNPNPAINFTDANFKAKLLQADITTTIAKNICNQNVKIDSNSDGEIQTDEAARVYRLNVNSSNITAMDGMSNFSYLSSLYCNNNNLQDLNLDGMLRLSYLNCSNNALTTLDLSQTRVNIVDFYQNNLEYVNLKNGVSQSAPPEFPFNSWGNNPLGFICADASEIGVITTLLNFQNYNNVAVSDNCTLSVPENHVAEKVKMYPNPVRDVFVIESSSPIKSIDLFDIQGRNLYSKLSNNTSGTLDFSPYPKGIYLIRVFTEDGIITERIVKE
jgi:hypothetical protein